MSCGSGGCSSCGCASTGVAANVARLRGDDGQTRKYIIQAEKPAGEVTYQLLLPAAEGYEATIVCVVTDRVTGEKFALPTGTEEEFNQALELFQLEIMMLEDPLPML